MAAPKMEENNSKQQAFSFLPEESIHGKPFSCQEKPLYDMLVIE